MMNGLLEHIGFYNSLNNTIKAIILLLLAFIFAAIARAVVKGVVSKIVSRKSNLETDEVAKSKNNAVSILGNLSFAIVFMLFLPGALEKLGITSVTEPIQSMTTKFLSFLPNIIAAVLIMVFGIFLAKFVREIVAMGLKKTKLDSLQQKCGIKNEKYSFSEFIASILYAIVMVVFAVAAIRVLNLETISGPATSMVSQLFDYVPRIFATCVLVIFGIFLGNIVANLLDGALKGTTLDEKTAGLFPKKDGKESAVKASGLISSIVRIVIDIMFAVAGIKILKIDVLTQIGTDIIAYLPNLLAAFIILLIAWICANKASSAIINANEKSTGLAITAKVAIFALAAFMAVQQLGIATMIVNVLFGAIAVAGAVAFAIAFGVGGRNWAGKKLEEMDESIKNQIKKK